ncbi:MAG: hypothetical protein H6739_08090 [Alphaproteobacteria bacterium]|nr:hypothetical protein [Alphaproteobacteria bacterium]
MILLLLACWPEGPTEAECFDRARAAPTVSEAMLWCDRIHTQSTRGDCVLSVIERLGAEDPGICGTLLPGSDARDRCWVTLGSNRAVRAEDRAAFCEESGPYVRPCLDALWQEELALRLRTPSRATVLNDEIEALVQRHSAWQADVGERLRRAGWWGWQRQQASLDTALCEDVAPCVAAMVERVQHETLALIQRDPETARAVCAEDLGGLRFTRDLPRLGDDATLAEATRRFAAGWCADGAVPAPPVDAPPELVPARPPGVRSP